MRILFLSLFVFTVSAPTASALTLRCFTTLVHSPKNSASRTWKPVTLDTLDGFQQAAAQSPTGLIHAIFVPNERGIEISTGVTGRGRKLAWILKSNQVKFTIDANDTSLLLDKWIESAPERSSPDQGKMKLYAYEFQAGRFGTAVYNPVDRFVYAYYKTRGNPHDVASVAAYFDPLLQRIVIIPEKTEYLHAVVYNPDRQFAEVRYIHKSAQQSISGYFDPNTRRVVWVLANVYAAAVRFDPSVGVVRATSGYTLLNQGRPSGTAAGSDVAVVVGPPLSEIAGTKEIDITDGVQHDPTVRLFK